MTAPVGGGRGSKDFQLVRVAGWGWPRSYNALMLVTLNARDWQVLRAVLRHRGAKGCPGAALRLTPTHITKDGSFLAALAGRGLLEAAGPPDPPADGRDGPPGPFRTRWRLTDLGRHAAEYGEYEVPGGLALPTPAEFAAAKRAGRDGQTKRERDN